jgi:hypothetical protein
MSLPAAQQRILVKIEGALSKTDPALSSRFVIFGRLTRDEAMPWLEQIKPRPIADRLLPVVTVARRVSRRPAARVRALLLLPAALTAMLCALAISFSGIHRGVPVTKSQSSSELVMKPKCRVGLIRGPVIPCPR